MSDAVLNVLRCPACGSSLAAKDLDEGRGLATCGHCGALMSLPGPPRDFQARPEIPLPRNIRLRTTVDGVEIRRRWLTLAVVPLLFFAVVWNSFLFGWYSLALGGRAPWIMLVFPLIHVAVGVMLIYWTLTNLFNRTSIVLDWQRLTISHGPLPWPGNRVIPRDWIDQFYCLRKRKQNNENNSVSYEVWMRARDGNHSRVIAGGLTPAEALALEQHLERAMNIPDRPVPGELPRDSVP